MKIQKSQFALTSLHNLQKNKTKLNNNNNNNNNNNTNMQLHLCSKPMKNTCEGVQL